MRHIKLLLFLLVFLFSTVYAKTFSNLIVFGDSLSDSGNMPEIASSISEVFYVPVSNPIRLEKTAYLSPIPQKKYFPSFLKLHKKKLSLLKNGNPSRKKQKFNSSIWPEFFIADCIKDNLTQSNQILPSAYLESINLSHKPFLDLNRLSVNYAWASALSKKGCYTKKWKKFSGICNREEVLKAKSQYYKNRIVSKVKIPGLLSQIEQFQKDLKEKRVKTDSNTVYAIWIGGNDLNNNFKKLQSFHLGSLKELLYGIARNNYVGIKNLIKNEGAKNIYLFNLFNVDLTPYVINWKPRWMRPIVRFSGKMFAGIYNLELKLIIDFIISHKYPKTNIHLVNIHKMFNNLIDKQSIYSQLNLSKTIGQSCKESNPKYLTNDIPFDNCKGYLFWDKMHPTMAVEQIIAYNLEQQIKSTK